MKLKQARQIAFDLTDSMRPYIQRIEIAGSIRRGKEDPKDIEIVAVPEWGESSVGLFDDPVRINKLLQWALDFEASGAIQWIKPGVSEIIPWEPKRDGKYWQGLLKEGVKLDLFLCQMTNFGLIFMIRTGPAEFSQSLVTRAKSMDLPCEDGYLRKGVHGEKIVTMDERKVFEVLKLPWMDPDRRIRVYSADRESALAEWNTGEDNHMSEPVIAVALSEPDIQDLLEIHTSGEPMNRDLNDRLLTGLFRLRSNPEAYGGEVAKTDAGEHCKNAISTMKCRQEPSSA